MVTLFDGMTEGYIRWAGISHSLCGVGPLTSTKALFGKQTHTQSGVRGYFDLYTGARNLFF